MIGGWSAGWGAGRGVGFAPGSVDAAWAELKALCAGGTLVSPRWWILDPVSNRVLAFVDELDPTHLFIQTDSTRQVQPPQPDPRTGVLVFTFTGAEWYDSTRLPAAWQYLHDGTGGGCYYSATPTEVAATRFVCTSRGNANAGFSSAFVVGPNAQANVLNAGGSIVSGSRAVLLNTPVQVGFNYQTGATTPQEWAYKVTGFVELTGVATGAPLVVPSLTTMRIGARGVVNDFHFRGRLALICFARGLSAEQRTRARSLIQTITKVAA